MKTPYRAARLVLWFCAIVSFTAILPLFTADGIDIPIATFLCVMLVTMSSGFIVLAHGLSKGQAWSKVVAYIVLIAMGMSASKSMFTSLSEGRGIYYVSGQFMVIVLVAIALISLVLGKVTKDPEPIAPENLG